MGDYLQKVSPGSPLRIPAAAYNAFIEATRDFQSRQRETSSSPQVPIRSSGLVLVRNDSGVDLDRYSVLGISAPLIPPTAHLDSFKERVALIGVRPVEPDHVGKFVVLLDPLQSGAMGRAYGAGVCPVKLYVADEADALADIAEGDMAQLHSAPSGSSQILWKESGTGSVWALVRLTAAGSGSKGTTRFTVHQMLTDTDEGWDFIRFH